MKHQAWMALPLAFALALPVAAQQAPATDTNAPAQSTSQQNQAAPASTPAAQTTDQNATGHQPLTIQTREGFWGHLNPFARKKYVQRQLSPIAGRVNELDELTAKNTQMIKDVDQRAQEGIRLASNKANDADMHAVDAGNRAQLANQTAQQANTRLQTVQTVVTNIDQYKPSTQIEIRFRPGQAVLNKRAKDALDQMATPLKDQKGYVVEIQGFSSGRGQSAIENSQRMADAVVRYLVLSHEVPVYRIYTVGMGNAPVMAENGKRARSTRGGRVEISLLKNDVEQLATADTASPAATPSNQGGVSGTATEPSAQPNQSQPQSSQPSNTVQPSTNTAPQQPQQTPPPPTEPQANQPPAPQR